MRLRKEKSRLEASEFEYKELQIKNSQVQHQAVKYGQRVKLLESEISDRDISLMTLNQKLCELKQSNQTLQDAMQYNESKLSKYRSIADFGENESLSFSPSKVGENSILHQKEQAIKQLNK